MFYADIKAYQENPPAAGRDWWWAFPDTWTVEDTATVRRRGCTIVEYLPQHLATTDTYLRHVAPAAVIAMGRSRPAWNPEEL